jgi:hypothetical protein
MPGVEVRLPGGAWSVVSPNEVEKLLQDSIDFICHYDMIETPPDRMQILDFAIPAFLEAIPKFGKLLESMNGVAPHPTVEDALAGVASALQALPTAVDIWDWPDTAGNRSALRQAFSSCRYYSYGPALMTKMLHLKRRRLIIPIDTRLRRAWTVTPGGELDGMVDITFAIGSELRRRRGSLRQLRKTADGMGWPYNNLSTLRLYDIVSWWKCA